MSRLVNAIRDTDIVFSTRDGDPSPATLKYVLLALATFADDDGTRCYPGVRRLHRSTGLDVRTVQKALHALELQLDENDEPILMCVNADRHGGRGRTTRYEIHLGQKGGSRSVFLSRRKGGRGAERVAVVPLKGGRGESPSKPFIDRTRTGDAERERTNGDGMAVDAPRRRLTERCASCRHWGVEHRSSGGCESCERMGRACAS